MKKILSFVFGFIAILALLTPNAYAQQNRKPEITRVAQNAVIDHDYLAAREQVQISGTINGDAYVAGGVVRIDGTISQDLLAAGGNILVTGDIRQDVRVAGGNITFSGATIGGNVTVIGGQITLDKSTTIGGSVVSAGGNIQILSPVTKGINVAGGNVEIGGTVGGDVMAAVGEMSLLNEAGIDGNLTYISESEAYISEGATVSGEVKQQIPPQDKRFQDPEEAGKAAAAGLAGFLFFLKLADVVMLLLMGLLFIWLFPIYAQRLSDAVKNNFWMTLLAGFLFIVLTPILIFLLMITVIGIPLGFLIFVLYLAILWFARAVGIYAITQTLLERNQKTKTKRRGLAWTYVIGVIAYFVISLIPIVSSFADIVIGLSGVGALVNGKRTLYSEFRQKKLI